MLAAFLQGFGLDLSLIVAIGAQNAFVLRQGLRRLHVFATALVSSICDVTLIVLGVGGVSSLLGIIPVVARVATAGGALFLFYYGLRSFRSALTDSSLNVRNGSTVRVPERTFCPARRVKRTCILPAKPGKRARTSTPLSPAPGKGALARPSSASFWVKTRTK